MSNSSLYSDTKLIMLSYAAAGPLRIADALLQQLSTCKQFFTFFLTNCLKDLYRVEYLKLHPTYGPSCILLGSLYMNTECSNCIYYPYFYTLENYFPKIPEGYKCHSLEKLGHSGQKKCSYSFTMYCHYVYRSGVHNQVSSVIV